MKILGMGVPELVIILIVALLIFGPKNLPKLGSALGKTVKNLREGMGEGADKQAEEAIDEETVDEEGEVLALEDVVEEKVVEEEVVEERPAVKKTKKVAVKKPSAE